VGSITGLAISPDQKRLATAASREVKIWDLRSGQEAVTLPVPESPQRVVALGWTTDGQRLRAAFGDASVVEWDGTGK
jgi:WD40 repeat protein